MAENDHFKYLIARSRRLPAPAAAAEAPREPDGTEPAPPPPAAEPPATQEG